MFAYLGNKGIGYSHTNIIYHIAKQTACRHYLELGCYDGYTLSKVAEVVPNVYGVDIKDERLTKQGKFYEMTTDVFFKIFNQQQKMDIIFIDADHSYEAVKRDFENSLNILNEHGIIFIHDTDPMNQMYMQKGYCGDSYKVVDYIQEKYKDELNIITIPINECGMSMVNRKKDRRTTKVEQ